MTDGTAEQRQELHDELVRIATKIATDHIVGRAFCWVDTPLIVELRKVLGIEPHARPDVDASYKDECRKRGIK